MLALSFLPCASVSHFHLNLDVMTHQEAESASIELLGYGFYGGDGSGNTHQAMERGCAGQRDPGPTPERSKGSLARL